mgnify:CR=1 FL=1
MTTHSTYLISTDSQPRARRPADAATAAAGFVLMLWGMVSVDHQSPMEEAVGDLIASLPSWLITVMELLFMFGLVYGVGVVVAIVIGGRSYRAALRDVLVALLLSVVLAVVVGYLVTGAWPYVLPEIGLDDPSPRFPVLRIVIVTAALIAASPYLAKPLRRLGWLTILLSTIAAVSLGYGQLSDAIGAMGIGMMVAGCVLLVFGSPRGYPDPNAVSESLRNMGLQIDDVRISAAQTWGVRRLVGVMSDGSTVAIKAYGRDASDSMRMSKAWRTLWYREGGSTVSYSRLEAVEHEALVTVLAERAGVKVADVIAAGETSSEIALLVQQGGISRLSDCDAADISDEMLVGIWQDVGRLHGESMSHGSLTTAAILYDGSEHFFTDFSRGSIVADESDESQDVIELLFSMTLLVGQERAVNTAVTGLGIETISAALPYLQLPAVSRGTRNDADHAKARMKELQAAVTEATDTTLPEPVKLRRVTTRNIAMSLLLLLALGALVPMLAGIDYAEVWSVLENAKWGLMIVALVVGETMFIPQAMGMMYAVGGGLPFWPLTALQVSIMFIGLAVPSAAGRIGMNSAFLRKFGIGVTKAITQGALDSFSGFLVETVILLLALLSGNFDLGLDFESQDVNWLALILIVVGFAIVSVVALRRSERLRNKIYPEVHKAWGALRVVSKDPAQALGLLGSNLLTRLVMAASLWLILQAVDAPLSFAGCLVAVVATNLLQGIVPVPGGIGVSETVMTGFLVALGVDQNSAFAATISWRVITFYLPSGVGFFTMKWLERNEYL